MQGENHPKKRALRNARQGAIDRLTAGFVADELGLEEFEERVDRAYRCRSTEELDALTGDLAPPEAFPAEEEPSRAIVAAQSDPSLETRAEIVQVRKEDAALSPGSRTLAVFGNTERRGRFHIDGPHLVMSVFGNVEIDLREISLPPGVTTLRVRAIFGSVEITVPPSLIVECEGTGVLGSFTSVNHVPDERVDDEPVLRIVGSAVFGVVDVRTRPSGALALMRHSSSSSG